MPYVNTSSYSVPSQFSLERAYGMFRTLGIRHMVVTDQHNQVMGIITRKDLMGFRIDDKIRGIILRSGIPRDDFTSPHYLEGGRRGSQKQKQWQERSNSKKLSIQEENESPKRNILQGKRRLSSSPLIRT